MPSFGKVGSFFRLIRWKNLLIIAITMVLMRYAIIDTLIGNIKVSLHGQGNNIPLSLQFPLFDFIVLVFSTICIAAGGYIINDYFDIKTDLINKGKVIVGTSMSRQRAMMWHNIFNVLGVAGGFYVSARSGYVWFGVIFLLISGLLYFYSASYKRQFLIGNLVVAFLTAMVPMLVVIYEWPPLYTFCSIHAVSVPDFSFLFYWVGGFSLFAFLTNLIREIVKDIEDFEGDVAYGRNTLPIVLGVKSSKVVVSALAAVTIVLLYLVWFSFVRDWVTLVYLSLTVAGPLAFLAIFIHKSNEKRHFRFAGGFMKAIMLAGLLYSVVVNIIIKWNLF
ncbi:MAG TPA: UbiA family prenyltransferase [Bacteroidetes bacterium]|jgi:4-hydroxybenzoate polyprenyltransferase|nr:UbiA family prenyltransferase [Bacteroidota bacterium]